MSDELLPNYRKPVGEPGRAVIEKMYAGHADMTGKFVTILNPQKEDVVLDVGCGGGLAVALMAEKAGRVCGIDYSDVSVEKALEYNRDAVREGRVSIQRAEVRSAPFEAASFSLITAIETVYFWDDPEQCFGALRRLLKPGGRFAILTEAWKDGDATVNEPERGMDILRLNLYSREEFAAMLGNAGFAEVECGEDPDDRWLRVIAHAKA